jgi:hypothetical protein
MLSSFVIHSVTGSLVLFFVGGVSLLTLVLNGLTAGPLLRYLGLTGSGEGRTALLKVVHNRIVNKTQSDFKKLREENKIYSIVPPTTLSRFLPEVCWSDAGDIPKSPTAEEPNESANPSPNPNNNPKPEESEGVLANGRPRAGTAPGTHLMLDPMRLSDEHGVEERLHRRPLAKMASNRAFAQFKQRHTDAPTATLPLPAAWPARALRRMFRRKRGTQAGTSSPKLSTDAPATGAEESPVTEGDGDDSDYVRGRYVCLCATI